MAEGSSNSSKRAWEIIESYKVTVDDENPSEDNILSNEDIDAYLATPFVEHSDLVNGWSALLSPQSAASIHDDIDEVSKPIDSDSSETDVTNGENNEIHHDLQQTSGQYAEHRSALDKPSAIDLNIGEENLLEYCNLELKDAADVLRTINDELNESYESLEIDEPSMVFPEGINEPSSVQPDSPAQRNLSNSNNVISGGDGSGATGTDHTEERAGQHQAEAASSAGENIHIDVAELQPIADAG